MEDTEFEESSQPAVSPATRPSLIRAGKHDLEEALKVLTKLSKPALQRLAQGINSPNEKVALDCAKEILHLRLTVSKEINSDSLQRTIAEIRNNPNMLPPPLPNSNNRPIADFDNIQEIN